MHHCSFSWPIITPLEILSSYIFYFGLKDPIKVPILRLSSALLKICHIPHVNFQTTSWFLSKFCIISSVSWKITPLYFFSSNNIYFAQKEPIKGKIFETFRFSGQNLSHSSGQFWNDKSLPLQILYHSSASWKITLLYFLAQKIIYFAQKEPIKVKIFETFNCWGQNLSNSSCQFWNHKLISLQILYHSSVSWKITPMYFFSSNNIYFAQKEAH